MDSVATLQRVVDETTALIDNVTPDELGRPTPCAEWSVRDLINHIVGGSTMFAISAEEGSVPDKLIGQLMGGDNVGDDYKGAWAKSSARAMAVFGQPGVLERIVKLPFGEMPAGVALDIAIFDVATHACDIARATGQEVKDTDLMEIALETGRAMVSDALRAPGIFDAEKPCPPGAPVTDRLLAFAGRDI